MSRAFIKEVEPETIELPDRASTDYQDAQKIGQNYAHYNIIAVDFVKQ
jgi:hypothetical protein